MRLGNNDSTSKAIRSAFPDSEVIKRLFGQQANVRRMQDIPWRDLVDTRHELVTLNGEMIDKAQNENRELTKDEGEAWDELDRVICLYQGEMNHRDLLGDRGPRKVTAGRAAPSGSSVISVEEIREGRSPGSEDGFVDDSGKRIRVYRSGERISRREFGQADEPRILNAGHVAARVLRGQWASEEVDREARAMSIVPDASGGYMVPRPLSLSIIDYARAQSVCLKAGVKTIVMDSATLDLSRIESDVVMDWKAELAPATPSQPTIGRVRLAAKTVMCIIPVSGELMQDATPNLAQTLQDLITKALASELDRVMLVGAAANLEPVGLANTAGINTLPIAALLDSYAPFSQAVEAVRTDNHEPNALVSSPAVYGVLDRLEDTTGQPIRPPASYEALARYSTTNVAASGTPLTSAAFVGKWDEGLLGIRSNLVIRAANDGVIGALNLTESFAVGIVAVARFDFVAMRPAAFCHVSGLQLAAA